MDKRENNQTSTPEQKVLSPSEQFEVDLKEINTVIEAILTDENSSPEAIKQAWTARADITEAFIGSLESTPDNPKQREIAQFDVMVDKARIFEKAGNTLRFLEELDCAEGFALNEYLDDYVDINTITDLIDDKVSKLEKTIPYIWLDKFLSETVLKLRGNISFDNREFLRDLINQEIRFEDFAGDVYGMIIDENESKREEFEENKDEDSDEEYEEIDPDEIMISLGLLE